MTATAVLDKPLDKESEPSWKDAAYDIRLRQGVVSLVDGRFDAAIQGFQQAKQSAPNEARPGLDRLAEIAKNRTKLIPDELSTGDDRAATALALGSIYHILHRYDQAKTCFSLPLTGSTRSRSAAHRSFAELSMARVLAATASGQHDPKSPLPPPLVQAANAYKASLKEYPNGSWHEDTLRELALLIERAAAEQFPAASADNTAARSTPRRQTRKDQPSPLRRSPRVPGSNRRKHLPPPAPRHSPTGPTCQPASRPAATRPRLSFTPA